jgi:hypothetical protein
LGLVVTISVTAEALAAIAATLPAGRAADARPDGKGGYLFVLPHALLDRLKAMRGPGESYSDVILRLARGWGEGGCPSPSGIIRSLFVSLLVHRNHNF